MSARLDWSFADAKDAQSAFEATGGSADDPSGPLYQWSALLRIDAAREAYEAGDQCALMRAIRICACHSLVMPAWVAIGFIRGFDAVNNYVCKSWDDAFGQPLPKSAQISARRKQLMLAPRVWREVRRRSADESITDALFESVGKPLGLGLTRTKDYYYAQELRSLDALKTPGLRDLLDEFLAADGQEAPKDT